MRPAWSQATSTASGQSAQTGSVRSAAARVRAFAPTGRTWNAGPKPVRRAVPVRSVSARPHAVSSGPGSHSGRSSGSPATDRVEPSAPAVTASCLPPHSCTAFPAASRPARTSALAVPTALCPPYGDSPSGVITRTPYVDPGRAGGTTNAVSVRAVSRATASMSAVESAAASGTTPRAQPPYGVSVNMSTISYAINVALLRHRGRRPAVVTWARSGQPPPVRGAAPPPRRPPAHAGRPRTGTTCAASARPGR